MSGEYSKSIGEIGENISENFLKLIGWNNSIAGESLPCIKGAKHKRKEAEKNRTKHGIDLFFNYSSPLENSTINNVVISVKNTDKIYPKSPQNKFKEHFNDLALTLECYKNSELKKVHLETKSGYQQISDIGLLIWMSKSDTNFDVVSTLETIQIDKDLAFNSIYVIDNRRVSFIFDTLKHLHSKYKSEQVNYFYEKTNINFESTQTQHGNILPIEYINSPFIPFLIKISNLRDTFCIACIDEFDEAEFHQTLLSARRMTNDMSCNLLFLYPNYTKSDHDKCVKKAKISAEVNNEVEVESYNSNYRSLND